MTAADDATNHGAWQQRGQLVFQTLFHICMRNSQQHEKQNEKKQQQKNNNNVPAATLA